MDNVLLLGLIGVLMVPVVSFLKASKWSTGTKFVFSMLLSVAVTVGLSFATGTYHSVNDVIANGAVVWAAAQAFYQQYFASTGLENTLASKKVLG